MCKNIPTLPGDSVLLRMLFSCVYVGYQYVKDGRNHNTGVIELEPWAHWSHNIKFLSRQTM